MTDRSSSSGSNATSGRAAILGKVRAALGVEVNDRAREFIVQKRLKGGARNLIPSRADLPLDARLSLFQNMLEAQSASVDRIEDEGQLPQAVARYLSSQNMAKIVRMGDDPLFEDVDWETALIECQKGSAESDDTVSLAHAAAGASETGTLFLCSGPDNPTSLNFLPEAQIIALHARDISGSYEDAWAHIRKMFDPTGRGGKSLPRTINLVSGPSRTGDIEQTIIMGAHGPRLLHVIIIGKE